MSVPRRPGERYSAWLQRLKGAVVGHDDVDHGLRVIVATRGAAGVDDALRRLEKRRRLEGAILELKKRIFHLSPGQARRAKRKRAKARRRKAAKRLAGLP